MLNITYLKLNIAMDLRVDKEFFLITEQPTVMPWDTQSQKKLKLEDGILRTPKLRNMPGKKKEPRKITQEERAEMIKHHEYQDVDAMYYFIEDWFKKTPKEFRHNKEIEMYGILANFTDKKSEGKLVGNLTVGVRDETESVSPRVNLVSIDATEPSEPSDAEASQE